MRSAWLLLLALCKVALAAPEIKVGDTTVVGRVISGDVNLEFFGGIPFAEPPVRDLRFAPPVLKASPGVSTFNATQWGASCVQFLDFTPPIDGSQSEDCLSINVVRPAGVKKDAKLPVMFWVYGGAFEAGASNQFDPTDLVKRSAARGTPIVFVSFNYRLGPLGFPQGSEAAAHGSLNLGLKDTQAALEWVQHNIAAFGGDKSKVTAFGESAGAYTIGIHMLNPGFDKLVRGAIMESGVAPLTPQLKPSDGDHSWSGFALAVSGCEHAPAGNTFDCLRKASIDDIRKALVLGPGDIYAKIRWNVVVDGPGGVFPARPTQLYERGIFTRIPFIAGSNKDEGTLFTDPNTTNETAIEHIIRQSYDVHDKDAASQTKIVNTLMKLYPDNPALGSPFDTGNETFDLSPEWKRGAAIFGDATFQAPRRALTRAAVKNGVKGYGYLFKERNTNLPAFMGVSHGSEVPYIFPNTNLLGVDWSKTPSQAVLEENMMDYWISFADSLDPNDKHGNSNRPHWPLYGKESAILRLDAASTVSMTDNYRQEQMDYLIKHA